MSMPEGLRYETKCFGGKNFMPPVVKGERAIIVDEVVLE